MGFNLNRPRNRYQNRNMPRNSLPEYSLKISFLWLLYAYVTFIFSFHFIWFLVNSRAQSPKNIEKIITKAISILMMIYSNVYKHSCRRWYFCVDLIQFVRNQRAKHKTYRQNKLHNIYHRLTFIASFRLD